ncbi:MAG: Wzz/FepE/Etk N-terminal domain-containing protein [bacterium]
METELISEYKKEEIQKIFKMIWERKKIVFITIVFALMMAVIYNFFIVTPLYKANATIQLSNVANEYSDPDMASKLLKSNSLVFPAIQKLEEDYTESQLQSYLTANILINQTNNSRILDIVLFNEEPLLAANILTEIINIFKEKSESQEKLVIDNYQEYLQFIDNTINDLENQLNKINQESTVIMNSDIKSTEKSILISTLLSKESTLINQKNNLIKEKREKEDELIAIRPFQVLTHAYVSENPVNSNEEENIAIAVVLGLIVSLLIIMVLEIFK